MWRRALENATVFRQQAAIIRPWAPPTGRHREKTKTSTHRNTHRMAELFFAKLQLERQTPNYFMVEGRWLTPWLASKQLQTTKPDGVVKN